MLYSTNKSFCILEIHDFVFLHILKEECPAMILFWNRWGYFNTLIYYSFLALIIYVTLNALTDQIWITKAVSKSKWPHNSGHVVKSALY